MDDLAIVERIIEQHRTIRSQVGLVQAPASDLEAIVGLRSVEARWSQSSTEALADNQKKLIEAVTLLDEGLRKHFSFEEKYLPPLIGTILMRALLIEHEDMKQKIGTTRPLVSARLAGLGQPELLEIRSRAWEALNEISLAIEEHLGKEDALLRMLQKALSHKD